MERTYDEGSPKVMLMYAWQKRLEFHDLVEKAADTCRKMKVDTLMIENKAAGISVAQEIRRLYADEPWSCQLYDPRSLDKVARLHSVVNLFAKGMIYAPDMQWAEEVITQVAGFPHSKHDDLVDTVSQALRKLRDMGMLQMPQERLAELDAAKQYGGRPPEPLYPV
jgi:predicted phage terminase large subunit-like protein